MGEYLIVPSYVTGCSKVSLCSATASQLCSCLAFSEITFKIRITLVSGFCPEQNSKSKVIPSQSPSGKSRVHKVEYLFDFIKKGI